MYSWHIHKINKEMPMSKYKSSPASSIGQSTKKFFLTAFVIITFIAYIFHERLTGSTIASSGNNTNSNVTQSLSGAAGTTYKDGTYTGPVTDAYYGMVQVQAVIQNGKISSVQFLDYPHDRRTSQEINSQAMPWLQQEAIQAQSANVNIISGATLTSEAFARSLQAALQTAKG
jgi:uncharacterized protein with FMN-binding domain